MPSQSEFSSSRPTDAPTQRHHSNTNVFTVYKSIFTITDHNRWPCVNNSYNGDHAARVEILFKFLFTSQTTCFTCISVSTPCTQAPQLTGITWRDMWTCAKLLTLRTIGPHAAICTIVKREMMDFARHKWTYWSIFSDDCKRSPPRQVTGNCKHSLGSPRHIRRGSRGRIHHRHSRGPQQGVRDP